MKSFNTIRLSSLCAAVAFFAGSAALAATATSNMNVTASVTASCTISAGAMAFGAYDPTANSDATGTATLALNCTKDASATITLDEGQNPTGTSSTSAPERQMGNGTDYLAYFLYQDSGYTTAWGNTAGTGASYTGTGSSTNVTVYAKAAKNQNISAGSYSDTVTATVTF